MGKLPVKKKWLAICIGVLTAVTAAICLFVQEKIEQSKQSSISFNMDSDYKRTIEELDLGFLSDYDFKLHNADKMWVNLWLEKYQDGIQDSQPITELSYGLSPNKVQEGNIGLGILNERTDEPLVFLYGPSVRIGPEKIETLVSSGRFSGWESAIGEEKVKLETAKTYILGAYRVSKGDSIRTYDIQHEEQLKKMIQDDHIVLLLKIRLEEKES